MHDETTHPAEPETGHGADHPDHDADHDCELCSPPLIAMPPPQGRPPATGPAVQVETASPHETDPGQQ